MKRLLPLFILFFVACTTPKNTPSEPKEPSYTGLPIASYTVISTDQVLPSGTTPLGSFVRFRSTYNRRCQLTAGSSATLTVSGMEGAKIRSITLHMRSNKSAGAGSLTVTNDGNPVWIIDNAGFNSQAWHGSYTTDTVSVFHLFDPLLSVGNQFEITITATVNSLYIMRYDIEYEPAPAHETKQDTTLISGLKTITIIDYFRLTGPIQDNYIEVVEDTLPVTNEDLYYVNFFGDTAATIRHQASGTYIGCVDGSLLDIATPWSVDIAEDTTFTFYTRGGGGKYYTLETKPNIQFTVGLSRRDSLFRQHWVINSVE